MAVYACSDLHGCSRLWDEIKNFLNKDDVLYYLGDAIDRGPDGVRIMEELLSRPNTFYLKGNHEEMFEQSIPLLLRGGTCLHWLETNCGNPTWNFLKKEYCTKEITDLVEQVKQLPVHSTYFNKNNQKIIMCHAGRNPWESLEYLTSLYRAKNINLWLWDRDHLLEDTPFEDNYKNTYVVFGHTPVQILSRLRKDYTLSDILNPTIAKINDGHKIDIDLCTYMSGMTVLLNLDTFTPIYFYNREYDKIIGE